ncbi:MAG: beta-N-acetylhexosaminidase [Mucinivorans sp.]
MKKLSIYLFVLLAMVNIPARASIKNLLPTPQQITAQKGSFVAGGTIQLITPAWRGEFEALIAQMGGRLVAADQRAEQTIWVKLVDSIDGVEINANEAYAMQVDRQKITITALTKRGIYWALQTLRQLRNDKGGYDCCTITDYPAFAIRGFMQDVGRSYLSIEELKREIAKLSEYKINVFHWHLTENQSWRLESKIFPMINDSINTTRFKGKYYTIAQARELVAFASAHNVQIIPEIDMPGHSAAFERTFRHSMQSPEGMKILKLLIAEVCETFEGVEYLHIGTDEVKFTNADFVPEMVAFVRAHGLKTISWNPGWKYDVGQIDMTQMWSSYGRPQPGIPTIDSRYHYLNHYDAFADLIGLFNSKIGNEERGSNDMAGVILALWHDRYIADEKQMIIQNHLYPNMLAIAQRAWHGGGTEYFNQNGTNLTKENRAAFAEFENRMIWHKDNNFKGYPFAYVRQANAEWSISDPFPNGGNLEATFPPESQNSRSYLFDGKRYESHIAYGSGIYLRHVWGPATIRGFFRDPQTNHTTYASTWVYSPSDQTVGLWFSTQNYGRSEMDLAPEQGKWDYKDSKLWINGNLIAPPVWQSTHTVKSNETPLTNENFESRDPLAIHLNKGWNRVVIKLPVGEFTSHNVRLVKWMFNFAFVNMEGTDSIPGLIYRAVR